MRSKECLNESSHKAKKVTLVTWKASFGGIEKILGDYLKYLKDIIDFTVYSLRKVEDKDNLFSTYQLNLLFGHNHNIILYWKFLRYAWKNRNQVFHLFNAGPIILLILRFASVKKIIYHIHGTVYWKNIIEKIIRKVFWHFALSNKVVFLSNSEFSKKRFREQISPTVHIEVLYNPFDLNRFTPMKKKTAPGQGKRIFYVGRLVKGKNLFLWLEAAEYILERFPTSLFKIVGDGNLKEELAARIEEKKLESHIEITGYIEEIEQVYQENDLLLFLSEYESFGNVVVESVLTQTPVIASAIPSMKEIFSDYPEFLVELDNHIFQSIIHRLSHYDFLMESVYRARKDFLRKFNLENHISRVKTLYNEMEVRGEK